MDRISEYERVRDELARNLRTARTQGRLVGLRKPTSNLFRKRNETGKHRIDVHRLRHVLRVDTDRMVAEVEGMTTYDTLAAETLRCGLLPAVTPELKTITVGGAVSGLGIESSSFRHGLVHETVEEMDVLTGDGSVVRCSRELNRELFYCLPNSYATLGYILRLTVRLMPAKRCVCVTRTMSSGVAQFMDAVAAAAADPETDFLDGTVFGSHRMYVTVGRMDDRAPWTSDYTYRHVYYKSIPAKPLDYLCINDYIWRWDPDWFWCSKHFHAQHPVVRLLASPLLLNSATYQRLMRLSNRLLPAWRGKESIIQDVAIPVRNAKTFLDFLLSEIPVLPIWICPFRASSEAAEYSLYPLDEGLYINFGFWDVIPAGPEPAYYNKKVERTAQALHGRKALYSSSFYDAETFRKLYDHCRYDAVKQRFDPDGLFGDLYAKCVRAM